jgi:hypothetical protein
MPEPVSEAELVERFPWVQISHDNKHMFRGWLEKRLLINRCRDCKHFHHPPKPICPLCWSWNVEPTPVSGRGVVHLAMFLRQGAPAPGVDYAKSPHPVTTIELEEEPGLRITSTVVDTPLEEIRIGLPVELTWIDRYGAPFPAFRPRKGAR